MKRDSAIALSSEIAVVPAAWVLAVMWHFGPPPEIWWAIPYYLTAILVTALVWFGSTVLCLTLLDYLEEG